MLGWEMAWLRMGVEVSGSGAIASTYLLDGRYLDDET